MKKLQDNSINTPFVNEDGMKKLNWHRFTSLNENIWK